MNPNKIYMLKLNQLFKNKFKLKNSPIISNGLLGKLPKNFLSLKPIFLLIKIFINPIILRRLSFLQMVFGLLMIVMLNFLNYILLLLEDGQVSSEEI